MCVCFGLCVWWFVPRRREIGSRPSVNSRHRPVTMKSALLTAQVELHRLLWLNRLTQEWMSYVCKEWMSYVYKEWKSYVYRGVGAVPGGTRVPEK